VAVDSESFIQEIVGQNARPKVEQIVFDTHFEIRFSEQQIQHCEGKDEDSNKIAPEKIANGMRNSCNNEVCDGQSGQAQQEPARYFFEFLVGD
jgi:hypothetical protein